MNKGLLAMYVSLLLFFPTILGIAVGESLIAPGAKCSWDYTLIHDGVGYQSKSVGEVVIGEQRADMLRRMLDCFGMYTKPGSWVQCGPVKLHSLCMPKVVNQELMRHYNKRFKGGDDGRQGRD